MDQQNQQGITEKNLNKFVMASLAAANTVASPELTALAMGIAEYELTQGSPASIEAVAAAWARHPELRGAAAASRESIGNTRTRALEAIGKLALARALDERERLALIQRLSQWTPESEENLDHLLALVDVPELPVTFERAWARIQAHYDNLPTQYDKQKELAQRAWNFALDAALATAQPVAEELMDSLDAIRADYTRLRHPAKPEAVSVSSEVLERLDAAMARLDVLSIPYAAMEPVIEVWSQDNTGGVTTNLQERVSHVTPQRDAGRYIAVIEGRAH